MKQASSPFHFVAASYLIRIGSQRSWTLAELARDLTQVSDASVFYHTFQTIESHHYTTYSNDFAQWVMASANEPALAEELAAQDLRDFASVADLRAALTASIERHLAQRPQLADRPGYEPFYFCEAAELVIPLETSARNLAELAAGIRQMSVQTLHHLFISSRLRVPLRINDFSHWIENSLELPELAAEINRIDFYVNTLEGVREEIIWRIERWIRNNQ